MTRTPLRRRAETSPEKPAVLAPLPGKEEFQAECEALVRAVTQTLQADLNGKIQPPARDEVPAGDDSDAADLATPYLFVPPYSAIKSGLGADAQHLGTEAVNISRQLLEFLLRCVLVHVEFDEEQYQACNPDVAAAIKWSHVKSGREHYINSGYFEGRCGGVRVDETWYLLRNPDVAASQAAGKFESAAAQYRLSGASEWRVPNPRLQDAVETWKSVLDAGLRNDQDR